MRRTAGDWFADLSLFLFAACFAVLTADAVLLGKHPSPGVLLADQAVGALACAALFLRRRWPVQLAVLLLVAGTYSHFVTGATVVAVFTVAAGRTLRTTGWVAALAFAPVPLFLARGPELEDPATVSGITYFVLLTGSIGWGLYVRSRRQLVASLRERADGAHAEARRQAREDIAREMHDVLAHRLSLLSVHAGALEFNPGAPEEEIQRTAGVIRDCAHEALEDLREIIGVLRASSAEGSRPQPVLGDLTPLTEESRAAGTDVVLDVRIAGVEENGEDGGSAKIRESSGSHDSGGAREDDGGGAATAEAPAFVGRTAYRIVQEGLTNARKHAPGTQVTVEVSGGPGQGLTVRVSNPVPSEVEPAAREFALDPGSSGSGVPGAGQGLIGLAERARLIGGRLEHGRSGAEFRLLAWLPWAARPRLPEAAAPAAGPGV
ncbi:sensor histidine kinase [Streptomyces albidus (ex Kaewkla and Franco 2022)]|uniref:sensor histidine kinase n=1 Tax=Streptomyces albidus (ex Kaewkla and Franco 2022) TaxID=722709 RepID=UPI0028162F72|nr:histidine kinase [Streptomyces albidus (ex Kaewkla and Franco 2022)]